MRSYRSDRAMSIALDKYVTGANLAKEDEQNAGLPPATKNEGRYKMANSTMSIDGHEFAVGDAPPQLPTKWDWLFEAMIQVEPDVWVSTALPAEKARSAQSSVNSSGRRIAGELERQGAKINTAVRTVNGEDRFYFIKRTVQPTT